MKTLRRGNTGISVRTWENFLVGQGFYWLEVDGIFDDDLHDASVEYQKSKGLPPDGVVGPKTYAAALNDGFPGVEDDSIEDLGPNWPPRPVGISPLNQATRESLFGKFVYVPAPVPGNPEAIRITDGWSVNNLVVVEIPQLKAVKGAPSTGRVTINSKIANQFKALWQAWEDQGLLGLVTDFGGTWVPRFVRGSRTSLSNHSWGTAFDINVPANPLGAVPALVGKTGSVRKLVPTAQEHGFYWGGWYSNRPDGMHFEAVKIL